MRMVVLVAVAFALAGCSSPEEATTDDVPEVPEGHADHETHNVTVPVLTPLLSADVSNGTGPLSVNFTLDASPANASLSWTLAFGDGTEAASGVGLPAQVAHNFTDVGNFTVVLTLDGSQGAPNASLVVAVLPVPPVALLPIQSTPFSYSVGTVNCPDPQDMDLGTPANGVLWAEFAIAPESAGQGFLVTWPTPNDVFVLGFMAFYEADGTLVDYTYAGGGDVTGTVPLGSEVGVFSDCLGGPIEGNFSTTGVIPVDE